MHIFWKKTVKHRLSVGSSAPEFPRCNQDWGPGARQFFPESEPLTAFVSKPEPEPQKIYKLRLRLCGNEKLPKPKKGPPI